MPKEVGQQIVLPLSKAIELSAKSIRVRLGRSLITMSGIILAIAFLMSIGTSNAVLDKLRHCLLYTSPSPRDRQKSRMPSSA